MITQSKVITFDYNDIKSLTFDSPSNLHAIGYCAYEGCNLGDNEEIAIPDGVKTIGDGAFLWTKIRKIVIGEGVEWIGEGAFYDTTLESVTLPSTLKSIGNYAFMWSQLTAITLPENIRSIGKFAFGCSDIESIHIPASLKYLGNGPFLFCMNLSNITVDDNSSLLSVGTGNDTGVLFNKDKTRLIFFPSKVDLSTRRYQYKLPNSVKEIGGAAFSGRYPGLKSLVLPTNLELIDTCAFMTYRDTYLPLDELTIPAKAHIKIGSLPRHITKLYLMGRNNLEEERAGHAGLSFSVAGVNSTGYGGCPTTTVSVKPSMLDYYKPLEGYHADGNINKVTDTINRSLSYHLTTLCYDFDVDLTDAALANGAEAYIATEAKEGNFTDMDGNADKGNYMVMKKVDYLPSRTGDDHDQYTGVLIKGTAGSTISFKMGENDVYSSSQTLLADDNMLVGVPCYMYLNPKENNDGSEGQTMSTMG